MNTSDEFRIKYKHISPHSLEGYGLLYSARKSGYICPKCGNGTGDDGTGVDFQLLNDGYKGYCHKCKGYFDVFDLIAIKYCYNLKTQFSDVLDKARDMFGDSPRVVEKTAVKKSSDKKVDNFKNFIKGAFGNLENFFVDRKDFRALTFETLKKFGCGYVPKWYDGTPRMIIPTSFTHFLARFIGDNPPPDAKIKQHRGSKEIFGLRNALEVIQKNIDVLIFAVEGEIDAMSIYQSGFTAIAFGGSSISELQQTLLAKFPKESKFILMLDADETGKKQTPIIRNILIKIGFFVYDAFLDEKFEDANFGLQKNPDGLKEELRRIYADAEKFFKENPRPKIENPPAENKKPVKQGIKPTEVEGIVEITPDYKPPEKKSGDGGIEITAQKTAFQIANCPLDLTVPINFEFSAYGIKEKVENAKTGEEKSVIITHTPIIPTKILRKADNSDSQIELAVYNRLKNEWKSHVVPMTTIAKTQDIVTLADLGVNINSARARGLSNFLTDIQMIGNNAKIIPKILIYEQTGWTGNNCENFIYPPGENDFIVQNGGFNYEKKFQSKGEKEAWSVLFEGAYYSSVAVRYAVGLVLAAPLVKLCNSRSFQGVLIAPSGSSKSAVAKLAMSIYGNPNELKTTFNGTANFTDELSSKLNDLPCWIDEFQSADETIRKNFQNVIFNYAEEKTRGRLDKNAKMKKQFSFNGTRLCTSEQTVLQANYTQGAFSRVFEFEVDKVLDDKYGAYIHKQIKDHYGLFGRDWIEYVKTHKSEILATYEGIQEKYSDLNFIPAHLQHIALSYTGLIHFGKMLEAEGDIKFYSPDVTPEGILEREDIKFFRELLPTPYESNNIVRAREFLAEILVSRARNFHKETRSIVGDVAAINFERASLDPVLGQKYLNGDIAFFPDQLNKLLNENHYPSARSLMRGFFNEGYLEVGGGNIGKQLKTPRRIDGKSTKVYLVKAAAFDFGE